MQKPIYVTQIDLQQIWNKEILTNGGPFHQQLDQDTGKVPTLK